MQQVSKNFKRSEFACKCGCGFDCVDIKLVHILQEIRDKVGMPLIITSGNRCKEHNTSVKGAPKSYHTRGRAADFYIKKRVCIDSIVDKINGYGVIKYNNFRYHIDTREGTYKDNKRT